MLTNSETDEAHYLKDGEEAPVKTIADAQLQQRLGRITLAPEQRNHSQRDDQTPNDSQLGPLKVRTFVLNNLLNFCGINSSFLARW